MSDKKTEQILNIVELYLKNAMLLSVKEKDWINAVMNHVSKPIITIKGPKETEC